MWTWLICVVATVSFFVEDITPIVWNDKAYDHLVYDEQQKDLVMSFVENHGRVRQRMEDVIVGKGIYCPCSPSPFSSTNNVQARD
jgi:hypothetical protein